MTFSDNDGSNRDWVVAGGGVVEGAAKNRGSVDRAILRLAVPALGALVVEPLFLLADTAMVGHLGLVPLAGLGVASTVLQTIIGLMVFLAYATTPTVARRLGANDLRGAVSAGVDGLWLALALGVVLGILGWLCAPYLIALFGVVGDVATAATTYLTVSMLGMPAMLLVFAATGMLRGLQDTRTPLLVAGIGFAANIALNFALIYGVGWGIAGSAAGTVIAQWGMVAGYLVVISKIVARAGGRFIPQIAGVLSGANKSGWLFLRTASLRAALLVSTWAATGLGAEALAAHQVAISIYFTLGFVLDALAVAAQALIGLELGRENIARARMVLRRCVQWGIVSGGLIGIALIAMAWILPGVFTSSAAVGELLPWAFVVLGISAPLCGLVFVLDGVLIGAGDVRYLAWTGLVNLACYVPMAFIVVTATLPLVTLIAAFAIGYLAARAVTLSLRARGKRWLGLEVAR